MYTNSGPIEPGLKSALPFSNLSNQSLQHLVFFFLFFSYVIKRIRNWEQHEQGQNQSHPQKLSPSFAASRALYDDGSSEIHLKMLGYKQACIRVRAGPT